jgi:hypothetical protein
MGEQQRHQISAVPHLDVAAEVSRAGDHFRFRVMESPLIVAALMKIRPSINRT